MNLRRLLVHFCIAAAAGAAAYLVSARPAAKRPDADKPALYQATADELRQVAFATSTGALTLEPRTDDRQQPYTWLTLTAERRGSISFRGNRHAAYVLQGYAPLRAIRTLGHLTPAQLREGGLDGSLGTVTIQTTSGERRLVLGTDTVAGEGRRALSPERGEVFIVAGELLPSPDRAVREMFDSSLHSFTGDEISRVTIQSLGRVREALSVGHQEGPTAWSWREDPEHPSQELGSWAEHLERMIARGPIATDVPGEPVLTVSYFHAEQPLGFLKLWPCVPEDRRLRCFGMTEHTIGLVELSAVADQIINDAQRMLGAAGGGQQARAVK